MKTVKLGDIVSLKYGKALKQGDRRGGPVAVVGSSGVVGFHDQALSSGPAIVVGRKGSIGSVTWVPGDVWPIDTAYEAVPLGEGVDLRWLYWILSALGLKGMNKSAAVPGLNRDDVYRLSIRLPDLKEQRRISAILDQADEQRSRRRAQLERLAALVQVAFADRVREAGPGQPLSELASFVRGVTFKPEDVAESGVPVMRTKNVQKRLDSSDLIRIPAELIKNEAKYLQEGDTLVSSANSYNLVGKCCFVDSLPEPSAIGGFVSALRPGPDVDPTFLYAWFNSDRVQATVRSFGNKTTNISNLNIKRTLQLRFPDVSLDMQREFAAVVEKIDVQRARVERALALEDELFASLQHRAFRGEL